VSTTIHSIQALVAQRYRLGVHELLSQRRTHSLPRQIAMWLAWQITPKTVTQIGRVFERDHTTIAHGVGKIDELMRSDASFADAVLALMHEVSPGATAEYRKIRGLAA
jgi:chromosomal replication initiator protein